MHEALGMTDEALTIYPAFLLLTDDLASCFLTSLGIRIHPSHWFLSVAVLSLVPGQKVPIILAGVEDRKAESALSHSQCTA